MPRRFGLALGAHRETPGRPNFFAPAEGRASPALGCIQPSNGGSMTTGARSRPCQHGWASRRTGRRTAGGCWPKATRMFFSMGSLNPFSSANLLQSLAFSSARWRRTAYPGDTRFHMATAARRSSFVQMLVGNVSGGLPSCCRRRQRPDRRGPARRPPRQPNPRPAAGRQWGTPHDGPRATSAARLGHVLPLPARTSG